MRKHSFKRVQCELPVGTSEKAKMEKRRTRQNTVQYIYLDAINSQVRHDTFTLPLLKIIGIEQCADDRLAPPRRYDDVTVQILLPHSEYTAMKAAADRTGLRSAEYCRHAVVSYIAAITALQPDEISSDDEWLNGQECRARA